MKVSHDNESKLLKKCRELNSDIIGKFKKFKEMQQKLTGLLK